MPSFPHMPLLPHRSSAANDLAVPVAAALREKVRRLERAYSAQRAGQEAVPLGVPVIDALLPTAC